jgi:hypothetical protein
MSHRGRNAKEDNSMDRGLMYRLQITCLCLFKTNVSIGGRLYRDAIQPTGPKKLQEPDWTQKKLAQQLQ